MAGDCKAHFLLRALALSVLVAAATMAGCATPAQPEFEEFTQAGPASPQALPKAFNGDYIATFHTRWFGPLQTRLTAQQVETGFKANTEPGVAWKLVGGFEQVLGQVLAPFIFPSGMLLVWNSSLPDASAGVAGEGWIGPGVLDPWRAATRMASPDGPVEIRYRDGRVIAVMTLQRASEASISQVDYAALTDEVEIAVRERLFDRRQAASPGMKGFFGDVRGALPNVHDDLTYIAAMALSWRKRTDVALPIPYRRRDPAVSDALLDAVQNPIAPITVTFNDTTGIATLEAVVFEDPASVDRAMQEVVSRSPRGLILDLRNCTGIDLASCRVLSWLVDSPVDVGVVVPGDARTVLIPDEQEPGDAAAITALPVTDLRELSDYALVHERLNLKLATRLRAMPGAGRFQGPVMVLTSSRTRSTGEILAWLLQRSGRAEVVGERTAGRPRLSREIVLGQGFVLRIDEYDWMGPGGERLDLERGIDPDVRASRAKAPAQASERLLRTLPGG